VLLKIGPGTLLLAGLNFYGGGTIISAGTVVVGTTDNQNLPAQGSFAGAANAAGALGRPGTTVTLGDAGTTASNASPTLLLGGAFTNGHPISIANQLTSGTYTLGGSTDNNAAFTNLITVNQPLTIVQATNADINALTFSGGLTAGSSGLKPLTFAGPGNVNVTTTPISNGSGQLAVNVIGGALTLAAANTYTGTTTVSNGLLQVNGSLVSGSTVTVGAGGVLAGAGVINGPATVQDGGTLTPGGPLSSLSTLTFGNGLTLSSGSTSQFEISESPKTNDVAKVTGAVTLGGTLMVTNVSDLNLAVGDSFKLFNATSYHGAFTNVQLPDLSAGQGWNTNVLNTAGIITVVALTAPTIASIQIVNGQLVINGSGGPTNWNYWVMATTNLASPQWLPVATNQFDGSGNFVSTNALDPQAPQTFYRLQLQ
jgi:autotransporter-associated beta strand protein